ncbi:MAG: hypothetical protein AAF223_08085, partial [Bacteroidota bacterium]
TIVDKQLVTAFELLLNDQIEINNIQISRNSTGECWDNFAELKVKEHIYPDKLKIVESTGKRVWQYHHHLFVTSELKKKLEQFSNGELEFSEGFDLFA